MSNQVALRVLSILAIVSAALMCCALLFVAYERKSLEVARAKFAATFPDDASSLVIDTVGEAIEVTDVFAS